jgi:enoyl-CoA hydratase/carnithine racemase
MSETKTETKTAANPFQIPGMPPFPMAAMPGFAEMTEMWVKAMGDQQGRVAAMMDEMAKAEERAHAEAKKAVEEMARLTHASLDYARELSAQARKQMLENVKKAADSTQHAAKPAKA